MRIIDNKKDYYDYVVGEYGIDDLIVFDRRQSVVISPNRLFGNMNDYLFNSTKQKNDDYRKKDRYYPVRGNLYSFVLKAGAILYNFWVERFLIDDETVNKLTTLGGKRRVSNNNTPYSDVVLGIFPFSPEHEFKRQQDINNITLLPILKNTDIPLLIPAKEIYQNIYDFISSQKDIKIEDSRSDLLKLESAGFDKKESFRNTK